MLSVLLAVTWGSSFLLIDIAIEHLDTRVVPFGRSFAGAVALAFFPGARDAIPRRDWPRIAILGLVWMALPFWLFPLAEKTVASSVAGMMNGGLPVVMAAVTALWVRRLPSVQRIGAIALGFVGIVVVAWPAIQTDTTSGDSIADLRGVLFLAGALLCYALGANVARPLQAQYAPARLLMRVQIAAALWTLPFAADGARSSDFAWSSMLAVVGLGVVGTGIAFVAFGTLLERTGLTRAMIPTYFTPIVGLVLGTLFNNETIALVSVAGMLVVIASAWMTSKPDERDVTLSDATAAR
jgi:drug/metabolite transporter (DMT)-like permease